MNWKPVALIGKVFPRKGWKRVNGAWCEPAPEAQGETAADRRNYANRKAGWPIKQ